MNGGARETEIAINDVRVASGGIITRRYISRKLGSSIFSKVASIVAKLFRVAYLYGAVAWENWPTSSPASPELFMHDRKRNWIVTRGNTSESEGVHPYRRGMTFGKRSKMYTVPKLPFVHTLLPLKLLYLSRFIEAPLKCVESSLCNISEIIWKMSYKCETCSAPSFYPSRTPHCVLSGTIFLLCGYVYKSWYKYFTDKFSVNLKTSLHQQRW